MVPVTRTGSGTKDMAAIMERVRRMSDSQLADILAGKDVSIPQFAAMTEAMGRKQLRQAVDGAQAQQQAQQPSIKEQLLAEQQAPAAGLDALPAPNMESIDMAGGGIIAFDRGGDVDANLTEEEKQALRDRRDFLSGGKKLLASAADVVTLPVRGAMGAVNTGLVRPIRAMGVDLPYIPEEAFGGSSSSMTPYFDKYVRASEARDKNAADVAKVLEKPIGDQAGDFPVRAGEDAQKTTTVAPASAAPASGIAALTAAQKFERRVSPFAAMAAETQDYEKLKSQGLGEGLMKMGAGLLSAPGSKGFAAGIQALAESGAVSRKEINALKKDARDYDFNLKRAEAAFEQGNDELAYKYMQDANLNKYRMASLNQKPNELRTLEAIAANPQLAAIYKGGKGAGTVSRTDALKEWNDLNPSDKRKLQGMGVSDFNSYYSYLSTGLPANAISATVPQGVKVRD